MGGMETSKGIVYQGFASVIEALTQKEWDKISVEYPSERDKIDIGFESNGKLIKSIQVKSTINSFSDSNIKKWLEDLINDKPSKEYDIFLIGQCSINAIKFMKSVTKYQKKSIDSETVTTLKSFNTNLLDNGKISFKVLPFDEDILKAIVRDAVHHYVSVKEHPLTYEQISIVAKNLFSENLFSSLNGKGIERNEFDKKIKDVITQLVDNYTRKSTIRIESFEIPGLTMEEKVEKHKSFIDDFYIKDGYARHLKDGHGWNEIYKELKEFLLKNTEPSENISYKLIMIAHLSIAFSCGRILNTKESGRQVYCIEQKTNGENSNWYINKPCDDYENINIKYKNIKNKSLNCILIINITLSIEKDVFKYLKNNNINYNKIINCSFSSPSYTALKSGAHANKTAESISDAVRNYNNDINSTLHIFAAVPKGFMFCLGQYSGRFGKCVLYEYDLEKTKDGSYSPSISFPEAENSSEV